MPALKLLYFDIDGGRGETARIALSIGGIEFQDERISFDQWPARKPKTPFESIPVLEVDGEMVAQSNGINRYVGKLAGLYPSDALQAAFCDEAMDAIEEIAVMVRPTFSMTDEAEKKAAREALVQGPLSRMLGFLAARLKARGGQWYADGRLTVADIRVFLSLRHLQSGVLDYIPSDLATRVAPALNEHFERVRDHAGVKTYYAGRG